MTGRPARTLPARTLRVMRRRTPTVLLAATLVLGSAAACGDDDDVSADSTTSSETTEATGTTDGTTTSSSSTTGSVDPGDLPGERIELFPHEGAELAVVGVAADDILNVRAGPGVDFDVVAELDPLATGVTATGHNRSLDGGGIWAEVETDGETGWANVAFLSHLGSVDDITTEIAPTPADRPDAETMLELGTIVAEMQASEEPESRIVVVDGPTVGDLGEITVDVIGLGDDALGGVRLHVFGEPDPGGEGFTLRSVERTLLCTRGVSDGLCV